MLRPVNIIVIKQQGSGRSKEITMNFCTDFTIESTWEDLTQTVEITIPRKVYYRDENKALKPLFGINLGGFSNDTPLILRGDRISIYAGYKYFDSKGAERTDIGLQFDGFITSIDSKKPFSLKCEDWMWKLKQTPAPIKQWKGSEFQSMLETMVSGTDVTLAQTTKTTLTFDAGYFITDKADSVAQVLSRIKKDFGFPVYLRGTELRVGFPVYYPSETLTHTFEFQRNIIDSELQYTRKEDVKMSAIVTTLDDVENGTTKDGQKKIKKQKLSYLIYYKNGNFESVQITKSNPAPANVEGERRTFVYPPKTPAQSMIDQGKQQLQQYYYTGFRGTFTVFGFPFVKHGDNVTLLNKVLPENNGTYKVKKVKYSGGTEGLRQEIELDYKVQ